MKGILSGQWELILPRQVKVKYLNKYIDLTVLLEYKPVKVYQRSLCRNFRNYLTFEESMWLAHELISQIFKAFIFLIVLMNTGLDFRYLLKETWNFLIMLLFAKNKIAGSFIHAKLWKGPRRNVECWLGSDLDSCMYKTQALLEFMVTW